MRVRFEVMVRARVRVRGRFVLKKSRYLKTVLVRSWCYKTKVAIGSPEAVV